MLFLHAFPLHHAMWRDQLRDFGRWVRATAPDFPGFGASPMAPELSLPRAAQMLDRLLDEQGVSTPAILLGCSMGGYVALEFLRQFPQRVAALVLISTRARADTEAERQSRLSLIEQIQRQGMEGLAETMVPRLLGPTVRARHPSLVRTVTEMIESAQPESVCAALRAMAERRDATDLLSAIQCPTLVMVGEEDRLVSVEEAEIMQRAIPRGRLAVIPDAGHLVNLEQPERFVEAVERFLK
jgi:pimeloyl-ACP methyl ester carboxylesterase